MHHAAIRERQELEDDGFNNIFRMAFQKSKPCTQKGTEPKRGSDVTVHFRMLLEFTSCVRYLLLQKQAPRVLDMFDRCIPIFAFYTVPMSYRQVSCSPLTG